MVDYVTVREMTVKKWRKYSKYESFEHVLFLCYSVLTAPRAVHSMHVHMVMKQYRAFRFCWCQLFVFFWPIQLYVAQKPSFHVCSQWHRVARSLPIQRQSALEIIHPPSFECCTPFLSLSVWMEYLRAFLHSLVLIRNCKWNSWEQNCKLDLSECKDWEQNCKLDLSECNDWEQNHKLDLSECIYTHFQALQCHLETRLYIGLLEFRSVNLTPTGTTSSRDYGNTLRNWTLQTTANHVCYMNTSQYDQHNWRVPDQNCVSRLYNMLEIHYSGPEPLTYAYKCGKLHSFKIMSTCLQDFVLHVISLYVKHRKQNKNKQGNKQEK